MDDDVGVIYGLEFQARALTAQTAETDAIRFLVGTQSLKCDNQVHRIEFDEENNQITNKSVFLHRSGEVWHISSSPTDTNILATSYNAVTEGKCEMKSTIWKLPSDCGSSSALLDDTSSTPPALELLCHLNPVESGSDVKCVQWQPGDGQRVFSLVDNHILLWDLQESGVSAKLVSSWDVEGKSHAKLTIGTWNPHQNCIQLATANDTFIRIWDTRSQQQVLAIENAHATLVRDIDFNPNKQYYLASCGDDCKVKFWDIRSSDKPLKVLDDHSHWVWCVRYNHFHDQLLLTSSSDSRVILNSVASLSSEPFGHLLEDNANSEDSEENEKERSLPPNQDCIISTYEEHEDSVYAVEWSSADPWLFASLSYDGRFIINRVPKAVKYEILL